MAAIRTVEPVVRFCAVISRHPELRDHAIERIESAWGAVVIRSTELEFAAGGFYAATMGADLRKTLVALDGFVDPAELANWKSQTNRWENELAQHARCPESRPLNLDPGYLTQAKLVLATTKDRDHRIYLRDGMFAEVTLTYVGKQWQAHRWTYPSYRTAEVARFATACRNRLRDHLQATRAFRQA